MSQSEKEQIKELYMECEDGTDIYVKDRWLGRDEAGVPYGLYEQERKQSATEEMHTKHRWQYGLDGAYDTDEQIVESLGVSTSGLEYENIVFTKHDNGKLQYSLIPPLAEQEMVRVLTFGANKYSANNWKNCDDTARYIDAALRHIADYRMGKRVDGESRLHPLSHAMSCLSFVVDIELTAAKN